jgi:hypothetical protein
MDNLKSQDTVNLVIINVLLVQMLMIHVIHVMIIQIDSLIQTVNVKIHTMTILMLLHVTNVNQNVLNVLKLLDVLNVNHKENKLYLIVHVHMDIMNLIIKLLNVLHVIANVILVV